MSSFSSMQRSGFDERDYLREPFEDDRGKKSTLLSARKVLFFLLLFFLYEPFTTFYFFLPPLFGAVVWITFCNAPLVEMVAWFIYLYLFEVDHSLPSFSMFLVLFTSLWFLKKLQAIVYCRECLKFLGIVIAYSLLVAVLFIFKNFFYYDIHIPWRMIGVYIVLDWIFVTLYEKNYRL
ncbi:MAG: hypothetical protein GXO61_05430 [Epsilonproteobacteria bacterium]|nr:hypothetical protein [Campylobacterota bacterium]